MTLFRRHHDDDTADLAQAERRLRDLEVRADKVVPKVLTQGRRNNFAERLRRTLPPSGA